MPSRQMDFVRHSFVVLTCPMGLGSCVHCSTYGVVQPHKKIFKTDSRDVAYQPLARCVGFAVNALSVADSLQSGVRFPSSKTFRSLDWFILLSPTGYGITPAPCYDEWMSKTFVKGLAFLLLVSSTVKISAQEIQSEFITSSSPFSVPNGKVCEVLSVLGSVYFGSSSFTLSGANVPYLIPGFSTINSSTSGMIIYKMRDNIATTTTIPTSAVVIPTDATGPVKIILESSTDLVTWTEANPGSYGASTSKRFFRVRAVNQ